MRPPEIKGVEPNFGPLRRLRHWRLRQVKRLKLAILQWLGLTRYIVTLTERIAQMEGQLAKLGAENRALRNRLNKHAKGRAR